MKTLQINPYEKRIEIAELKDIDNNFSTDLGNDAIEVEKGMKIVAYPLMGEERNGFFYYVIQNEDKGKIYTFNGIGTVFCDNVNDEVLEKIRKKVVW